MIKEKYHPNEDLLDPTIPYEIKNSSHTHPLVREISHIDELECLICRENLRGYCYGCFHCNFLLCGTCAKNQLLVDKKRFHEHPLNLVPKGSLIFTCHACGVGDHRSRLCICIPCCFIIHRDCADLPRVIYINRHDHRISHVSRLDRGKCICRVCRKSVEGEYGSYSCSVCPDYVVHSRCATSHDVWDGEEMEDVPEEDPKELIPFRVVGEGLIKHISHEHDLTLMNDHKEYQGNQQCNACILPIYSSPNYMCVQDGCDFILHEICANLSKKKRHPSHRSRLNLSTEKRYFGVFRCNCCEQSSSGFAYVYVNPVPYTEKFEIDIRCASIADGFVHESHTHGELSISKGNNTICENCKHGGEFMLKCTECEGYSMCFCCATIPNMAKHKYDKHTLSLCYGEKSSGEYWCEICEERTDPHKWFYTCEECSSTLHIHCVVGETPYIRCGLNHKSDDTKWDVVSNTYASRPRCYHCSSRCQGPYVFKTIEFFFCSFSCMWWSVIGSDFGVKMSNLRIRYE